MNAMRSIAFVLSLAAMLMAASFAGAATLCVNPAGSDGCYTTIQAAINAAGTADTVQVYPGVYSEKIVISKEVYLIAVGEPCEVKILSSGTAITLSPGSALTSIVGFLIEAAAGQGIYNNQSGIYFVQNCVIRNCSDNGILSTLGTLHCSNCVIDSNYLDGLIIWGGATAYLLNNIIVGNRANGIHTDVAALYLGRNCVWANGVNYTGNFTPTDDINLDPMLDPTTCYHLQAGSPCIDSGTTGDLYLDCDGTRNDIGVYGGPYAYCGPGPVVTSLQLVPATVVKGETFKIQATGAAR